MLSLNHSGKMKCKWLFGKHYKTWQEARAAVFEYIEIYYNRQRIQASNNYLTPEEYYNNTMKKAKAA